MGKSWKNSIMVENAQKKGAMFTKLAREIQVASRLGGPDPAHNARLKMAVDAAKEVSCPKDTIERAIKKGQGILGEGEVIEELMYEGYGPHGVGVMVECQTNNKHRTAPEIRNIFKKHDGVMGESGSVAWMFERVAHLEGTKPGQFDPDEEAIEAGANEVLKTGDTYMFYGNPEELDVIKTNLVGRGWNLSTAELSYKAKNITDLSEEQRKEVEKFLQHLDDNEDSHRIHATIADH
jgi:YebC/PmpR family DNA-binding regulatory protein